MAAETSRRYAARLSVSAPTTATPAPSASPATPPAAEDRWAPGRMVVLAVLGLFCGMSPLYSGLFDFGVWVPCALVVLAGVIAVFVAGARPRGAPAIAAVVAIAGLAAWAWLSTAWAADAGAAEVEAARMVLYAATFALFVCLVRGRPAASILLGGATVGLLFVALDVLSRMLFGEGSALFVSGRLNDPLGYVNGEAVAFLMALWPLVAVAERVRQPLLAAPAAGLAAVLACLVVLSQSRGAALGAALGIVVLVALVPGRQPRVWLLLVIAAVVAVLGQPVLDLYGTVSNNEAVDESTVRSAGVAVLLVGLATMVVWGVAAALVRGVGGDRPEAADGLRRAGAIVLVVGAVAVVGVGLAFSGRIADKVSDQYDSFVHLGSDQGGGSRLTAGGGNRYDFWRVAWRELSDHPVGGVGAGNYAADYFLERRRDQDVKQPHSLPLQILAELGLGGALLFAAFLVAVAVGLWRRARSRLPGSAALTVAAGGAFLAWLGASAVDWVHLFPGLAGIALAAAAVLVIDDRLVPAPPAGRRGLAVAGVAVTLAAVAAFGLARLGLADRYRADASDTVASDPLAALTDTSKSLSLDGDALSTYYVRAAAYARLGRYEPARDTLIEALNRDPDSFVTWTLLGDIAFRRGNPARAQFYYRRALSLNPLDVELRRLARNPAG
jgi:O-antigen ligase